jgi:hypothetical protein
VPSPAIIYGAQITNANSPNTKKPESKSSNTGQPSRQWLFGISLGFEPLSVWNFSPGFLVS